MQAVANAITSALQAGVSAHALHKMVDAAATSLRTTAASTADKVPAASLAPTPTPAAPLPQFSHTSHSQEPQLQQRASQSSQKHPQNPAKAVTVSTQALHAKPSISDPAAAASVARTGPASSAASPTETDAPYSFRRHRRMELQLPARSTPSGTISGGQRTGPKARVKIRSSVTPDEVAAQQDQHGQHPQQAQHAKQEPADAQDAQDPTRTSIRIKLRR